MIRIGIASACWVHNLPIYPVTQDVYPDSSAVPVGAKQRRMFLFFLST